MKTANTLIVHPETAEQKNALKVLIKAVKIKLEVSREQPYNPEFVEKIKRSRQEFEEGKLKRVKKEDLKEFLGLE